MNKSITNELVETLFKTFRLMKHQLSFTDKLIHLSALQIQALIFIDHNKNPRMHDIARHFRIELPSATSLLNKLWEMKLVKRQTDSKDRRMIRITLSTQGKKLLEQVVSERKSKLEKILSYLPENEKEELLRILKSLNSRLEK